MGKERKSLLKIISATTMVIFSLFALFSGTFAWFKMASNTFVSTSEEKDEYFSASASGDLINFNYELYKYSADERSGIKLTENEAKTNLSLNKYDALIQERNAQNNNILRFDISYANPTNVSKKNIKINIHCLETVINSSFSETGKMVDTFGYQYKKTISGEEKSYICNNISNVIIFKSFVYSVTLSGSSTPIHKLESNCDFEETNPNTIYMGASKAFKESSQVSSGSFFVENSKTNSLELNNSINQEGSIAKMVIYVEYNYDTKLISDFYNNTEFIKPTQIGEFDPDGFIVNFNKDIESIVLLSESGSNE